MKYRFVLFLIVCLVPGYGQVLVGPVVGPQLSWTRYDDEDLRDTYDVAPVFRYHVGAMVSFRVHKRFFLNTSLLYSKKGKVITADYDSKLKNKVIYNYIDMPILYTAEFQAKLGGNKAFKYYIGGGPNISYWLSGKGTISSTDIAESGVPEIKYKVVFRKPLEETAQNEMTIADPNRIQLGINVVAGLVLEPMGFNKIAISMRYEMGHSFLSETNGVFPAATDYTDVLQARNSGIRLSFAYLIDLKTDQRKKGKSTSKIKTKKKK